VTAENDRPLVVRHVPVPRGRVLRLVCLCGRNLADVRYVATNPLWTADKLTVTARPNVQETSYRPWARNGRVSPATADEDWHARTYSWRCRCGRNPTRRHEWITEQWARLAPKPYDPSAWRIVVDG